MEEENIEPKFETIIATTKKGRLLCQHCKEYIPPKTEYCKVPLKWIKGIGVDQIGKYKMISECGIKDDCDKCQLSKNGKCKLERTCESYDENKIDIDVERKNICMSCREAFEKRLDVESADTKYFAHLYYFLINGIFSYYRDENVKNPLPNSLTSRLYDWRNGTYRGRFNDIKNMKRDGYPFEVICEAFLSSMPDVKYAMTHKSFAKESLKINYICAIVEGNLYDTYENYKSRRNSKEKAESDAIITPNENIATDDNYEEQIELARQRKSGQQFKPKNKIEETTQTIEYSQDTEDEFAKLFNM